MNRLSELIEELCPNGVEYKKISEIYTRLKGTPITATKMKEIENIDGEIKIFAGGKTVINANEKDIPNANITRVPAVLVQSRGIINAIFYDKPFTFKNEMWAYTHNEVVSVKYLYYVLKNNVEYFRESASGMGALPQISLKVTENFKIPIPPLEVQCEIVRILDNFTELTAKLTTEFTTELKARKKQYEYYRDIMLNCLNGVEYKKLEECLKYEQPTKYIVKDTNYDDKYNIPVLTAGQSFILGYTNETKGIYRASKENPVIIFDDFTTSFHWVDFDFKVKSSAMKMLKMRKNISFRYIYYAMKSIKFVPNTHTRHWIGIYSQFEIPIPPLNVQHEIVRILDNLTKNMVELIAKLKTECETRQKQYEYYRDKLLTF